ncbi:MAG: S23 ribosomal protein [uncultured bacterium]|nr:MAG: S23 ribosomal protein [uncultured bacterium]
MFKFQRLNVWLKAKNYSKDLFFVANSLPVSYRYSFTDQLVRAGLSITNNIAEGTGRISKPEQRNFFNMSKGSVYETVNILLILSEMGLVDHKKLDELTNKADEVCKMLSGLIRK